ncbi:MAG: diacylglycerol kinase family lipid kinase [Nannocystaceae bacterium]|nr:diacylglycerol kinase family lipid kinase [Nannocystaceae bacterium]
MLTPQQPPTSPELSADSNVDAATSTASFLAVVNPAAGGGRCGKLFPAALERLRDSGIEVDVVETSRAGQATELVRAAWKEGRRHFIGAGGDGTGYEIINGMFPLADATETPTLGFLPMGTGNSFLRDFSEEGAEYSITSLAAGKRSPCDVMRLTYDDANGPGELHFINLMSIGFVADVNGLRTRRFKRWGEFGYIISVVLGVLWLKHRAFPIRLDGGEVDKEPVAFACFNNSKFTGGKIMMAPHASVDSGKIAYLRVGQLGRIGLLRAFPSLFSGAHLTHPATAHSQVQRIDFEFDERIDVMIDGEALQLVPRTLEVLPSALNVVA